MAKFIIHGGKQLKGDITVSGAKNSATSIIAATLLTEEECIIHNVPRIEDVHRMLEIIHSMGGIYEWIDTHSVRIVNKNIDPSKMNYDIVCKLRSSSMFIGALLARFDEFQMPAPGGCKIGARPMDAHFTTLEKLGVSISQENGYFHFQRDKLVGTEITMPEFSPTATNNILFATVLASGKSKINCADAGYSIQDSCWFLNSMGAKIFPIGSNFLNIEPVENLHGTEYTIMPDPIEIGTFISLASATRSEITIRDASIDFLHLALEKFQEAQCNFSIEKIDKRYNENYELVNIHIKPSSKLTAIKKIHNMPYPGFAPDLLPPFAVLMTQAEGTSLIHDWMYDDRLKYINELIKMGANAIVCDPHRALIVGPTPLYGQEITSFDLRAGATLIIAALLADGKSEIDNIYQVDRGYEHIDKRLKQLGADIERLE